MIGTRLTLNLDGIEVTPNNVTRVRLRWTKRKAESTGMGDDWKTYLAVPIKRLEIEIEGYTTDGASPESNSLREALFALYAEDGHQGPFVIRPNGTGSGKRAISGTMILKAMPETYNAAETATLNGSGGSTGTVTDQAQ